MRIKTSFKWNEIFLLDFHLNLWGLPFVSFVPTKFLRLNRGGHKRPQVLAVVVVVILSCCCCCCCSCHCYRVVVVVIIVVDVVVHDVVDVVVVLVDVVDVVVVVVDVGVLVVKKWAQTLFWRWNPAKEINLDIPGKFSGPLVSSKRWKKSHEAKTEQKMQSASDASSVLFCHETFDRMDKWPNGNLFPSPPFPHISLISMFVSQMVLLGFFGDSSLFGLPPCQVFIL